MDYSSNSHRDKKTSKDVETEKVKVEKVVEGEVVIKKPSLGTKIKDLFVNADAKGVLIYVGMEVLLPAARNAIVDGATKGIERMVYGDSPRRPTYGAGPRVTYNRPVDRGYRPDRPYPNAINTRAYPVPSAGRRSSEEIVLASREEAELVLERMGDILDMYNVVQMSDMKELIGIATTHVDNKWGWDNLSDARVRQIREGYLLDLPPANPI